MLQAKAEHKLDVQEPVEVTGVITSRKVPDDVAMELEKQEDVATVVQSPLEPLSVTETVSEDTVLDLPQEKKKTRKPKLSRPEAFSVEVQEVLSQLPVEEFGPGLEAVKEIATVNVMINKGVTVEEVSVCGYLLTRIFSCHHTLKTMYILFNKDKMSKVFDGKSRRKVTLLCKYSKFLEFLLSLFSQNLTFLPVF